MQNIIKRFLEDGNYEIRVRMLPKLTNAKKGYSINQNQIRSSSEESKIAKEINQTLGGQFLINTITSRTPGYISIFVYD